MRRISQKGFVKKLKNIKTLKGERNCGLIELQLRRLFSGMFYWHIYRKLHKNYPYYTPGPIKFLLRIINNSMEVFEWGSGLSSVWFAKRVKQVYIIEHDKLWYDKVKEWLRVKDITNVKLNLIEPVSGSFQNYCSSVEKYENESFNIIAVDVRDRINCIIHSLDKLKRGVHNIR